MSLVKAGVQLIVFENRERKRIWRECLKTVKKQTMTLLR